MTNDKCPQCGKRPIKIKGLCRQCYKNAWQRNKKRECSIQGCPNTEAAKGYCFKHYGRWRKYGDPLKIKDGRLEPIPNRGCKVPGCEKPHDAKGYCKKHYARWRRYGDPRIVTRRLPNPVKMKCLYCGKEYQIPEWQFERGDSKFCSNQCRNYYFADQGLTLKWRGGKEQHEHYYGPDWERQRKKALERDGYMCRKCGKFSPWKEPNVHHIIPFKEFGIENYKEANEEENLISLCDRCHAWVERNENNKLVAAV